MEDRAMRRSTKWLLAGVLLVSLLARLPGVYWGHNFPPGYGAHHPDEWSHFVLAEPLIDPSAEARWEQNYPKGLAAMTAVPIVFWRAATGQLGTDLPPMREVAAVGRVISVLFGVATVLIVFLLGRRFAGDDRVGLAAAAFLALGGLHVTQSHFFVADVPGLFFTLLGLLLLVVSLDRTGPESGEPLRWAALALGMAFGVKLLIAGLPSLALVAFLRPGRLRGAAHVAIFGLAGFVIVNLGLFTPLDLLAAVRSGINDPYQYSRAMALLVYLLESPAIFGLPLLALALAGIVPAIRRLAAGRRDRRLLTTAAVMGMPVLVHAGNVAFNLDVFPRHLLFFIPFAALAAGFALVRAADLLAARSLRPALLVVPVFAWLALFVADGERPFLDEPRNRAYRWLEANVAAGTNVWWYYHNLRRYPQQRFPAEGRPPYLVVEMIKANHILSGVGLRDSYPRDYRNVFDVLSQEEVDAVQAVFRGQSEYREVARFREGYRMPEYLWSRHWLGDRSRNYVTEIVIFSRQDRSGD
jgi:4-amino-4-deoxy-L-arabinose transferase-like glycosyltransferase